MDEIDAANERAEHLTNMAIQIALSRPSQAPSSGICRACGDPIESARNIYLIKPAGGQAARHGHV